MLQKKIYRQCLWRSWSVGSAMSTHHMQRVGLLYALDPALRALYAGTDDLRLARQRYLQNVRTHTVMAPLLVGVFIALEEQVAQHKVPAKVLQSLLHTTATTLSAIGDSFFSGTYLVFWALGCFLCFLYGVPLGSLESSLVQENLVIWPVLLWTGFLLALVTVFRVYTFYLGVHKGIAALQMLGKLNLINWAERIKVCNAVLIACIFAKMTDGETVFFWGNEVWGLASMLCAILLIKKAHTPRIALICLFFLVMFLQSTVSTV